MRLMLNKISCNTSNDDQEEAEVVVDTSQKIQDEFLDDVALKVELSHTFSVFIAYRRQLNISQTRKNKTSRR